LFSELYGYCTNVKPDLAIPAGRVGPRPRTPHDHDHDRDHDRDRDHDHDHDHDRDAVR
jgi:hypothetical protein